MTNQDSFMASVTSTKWEANIDANVSEAFSMPPSIKKHSSPSYDVAFFNAKNVRGDISKLSVSI